MTFINDVLTIWEYDKSIGGAMQQRDLTNEITELIRRTSSSLPKDVEDRLRASIEKEETGSAERGALETIMKNIELSRANSTPICQDTGTPIFYVHYPEGMSTRKLKEQIRSAVMVEATKKSYMRPNAVDAIYDKNSGNNLGGEDFPYVHFDGMGFRSAPGHRVDAQRWRSPAT